MLITTAFIEPLDLLIKIKFSIGTYNKLIRVVRINYDDDTHLLFIGNGPAAALLSKEMWATSINLVNSNVIMSVTWCSTPL